MKAAVICIACVVMLSIGLSAVDATVKPKAAPQATKQPLAKEPVAKKAKAGKGKCAYCRFLILDKPLLPFAKAEAACTKVGKKLATIDAIYSGTSVATFSTTAQTAIMKCVGQSYQVWYDTTLTKIEKPSTCTAFTVTLPPTDGTATARKNVGNTVLMPTTVLPATAAGCNTLLPVLCM